MMKMAILRTFLLAYSSEESEKVYANMFRIRLEKHLLVKDLVAIFKIIVWLKNPMSSSGKINFSSHALHIRQLEDTRKKGFCHTLVLNSNSR